MKRKILYYPYIDIDNGIWLRNALLYWDKVSSIMPYDDSDYNLSPEVQYLLSTEYFEPTRPDEIMFSEIYEDFLKEFKDKISTYTPPRSISVNRIIHRSKIKPTTTEIFSGIHSSKLSSDIIKIIERSTRIGLSENEQWLFVNDEIADIYMSVLAKYLAVIDNDDTVIGTDKVRNQNYAYKRSIYPRYETKQTFLNFNIDVLPTPDITTSIDDILNFKYKRSDELLKFRKCMNEYEKRLCGAEDITEVKEILSDFDEELTINVNDIDRVMRELNWSVKPAVMGALINAAVPNFFEIAEMFGRPIPLPYKGIGITAGVVLSASLTIREIGKMKADYLRSNAFSYIYHAKRHNLIK